MKRITALIMALAMILTLAACGGKSTDQPSNNTPPVTQGEQNQPGSNPADNTQPSESEPADTTPDEPQNNAGELPDGEFYLHDGVHHLSAVNYGDSYINSTVISGEKIANAPHEMFVELTEHISNDNLGSMLITLGQNSEPFNYQISFTEEDTAEYNGVGKKLAPGETDYFSIAGAYISVVNLTDTEKFKVDCPIIHFSTGNIHVDQYVEPTGEITLDGKSIATLDDLINILGTPTVAFSENSPESIQYIWQSEDFVYTAAIWCEFEEIFDENRQYPYFDMKWDTAQVIGFSYYALNYEVDGTGIPTYEPWSITFPVQALTDLGLL